MGSTHADDPSLHPPGRIIWEGEAPDSEYNTPMSLESISRVVSNAFKAAAAVNGGTPDEKGALDVLGGLAALLDSRIQLHKHASLLGGGGADAAAAKPKPIAGTSQQPAPAAPTPDDKKRQVPNASGDSYDLK